MQTLDAPVYEVKKESEWYQLEKKRREDTKNFFKAFKDKYGVVDGFGFYHSEYFGVHAGTESYDFFKNELVKNTKGDGFYSFRKRSNYFKEIKEQLDQIGVTYPFKSHDVLGLNNITASQWIRDRWFYGVKHTEMVKGDEVSPIDYKDYLKLVMEALD